MCRLRACGCGERALCGQRNLGDAQLAPEHETAELRGDLGRVAIGQQHQQLRILITQECENGNHAPLRCQPRIPLPLPNRQCLHVIGKLGMRERHCIRTAQADVLHVVQGAKTMWNKIQVVSHGRGGLRSQCCETTMIGHPTPTPAQDSETQPSPQEHIPEKKPLPKEIGGRDGPEPTRYGDWEKMDAASIFEQLLATAA